MPIIFAPEAFLLQQEGNSERNTGYLNLFVIKVERFKRYGGRLRLQSKRISIGLSL